MEKYLKILKKCQLFEDVGDDELLRMLTCLGARVERFERKDTVFFEGDPAEKIGILISGELHLISIDYLGNRNILEVITPSDMFCEAFACARPTWIGVRISSLKSLSGL